MSADKDSKTEKATPKKRRDTRRKGQVRKSTDANTTICAITMFSTLLLIWPWYTGQMKGILFQFLSEASMRQVADGMSITEISGILARMMLALFGTVWPVLGVAMIIGVVANVLQIGLLFTTEPLKFKPDKLNPVSGFKNMFSLKKLVDMIKNIAIVSVVGYIGYSGYLDLLEDFPGYVGQGVEAAFIQFMRNAIMLALRMCVAMIFIALADFLYQNWKYEKDIKMTKQEVKDEFKNMEGDPKIKGKIRQKQMQMSAMRMMAQVPEADVVITNPTHYAVALAYQEGVSKAPKVVAKGQDYIALKIREVALEHGVIIVENPPLAQSLFSLCELDDEVPEQLYQAVADVLVFVYRQKGKMPKRARA